MISIAVTGYRYKLAPLHMMTKMFCLFDGV